MSRHGGQDQARSAGRHRSAAIRRPTADMMAAAVVSAMHRFGPRGARKLAAQDT